MFTPADWTSAVMSVAWYATPDFIADRRRRNWTKAGIGVAGTALLAWCERDAIREARADLSTSHDIAQRLDSGELSPDDPEVTAFLDPARSDESGPSPKALAGVAAIVVTVLGSEVAIRRLSKQQEARGVRRPHLAGALLRGALTLGISPLARKLEKS